MLAGLLIEVTDGPGRNFRTPQGFRDVFYTAYRNACQVHFNQSLFDGALATLVTFDDSCFELDAFQFRDPQFHIPAVGEKLLS